MSLSEYIVHAPQYFIFPSPCGIYKNRRHLGSMTQIELFILVKWKESSKWSWTSKCCSPHICESHQGLSRSTARVASLIVSFPVKAANGILELECQWYCSSVPREFTHVISLHIFIARSLHQWLFNLLWLRKCQRESFWSLPHMQISGWSKQACGSIC